MLWNALKILEIKGRHGFQQLTTIIEISKTCGKPPGLYLASKSISEICKIEICKNKDRDSGGYFKLFACGALKCPLAATVVEETYRCEPDPLCRFLKTNSRIVPKPWRKVELMKIGTANQFLSIHFPFPSNQNLQGC